MPIRRFTVALDTPGRTLIAESSDKINAVSITKLSTAAECCIGFGNGQLTSPITARGRLKFPQIVENPDTREGAYLVNEVAQVGLSVSGFVSYDRKSDPPSEGIEYASAS